MKKILPWLIGVALVLVGCAATWWLSDLWTALSLLGCVGLSVLIFYLVGIILTQLADRNKFFTRPKAGQIVAIMRGDDLAFYLMWVVGHVFRHEVEGMKGIVADWDIIPGTPKRSLLNLLFGVEWVGIHPFREILIYSFNWKK